MSAPFPCGRIKQLALACPSMAVTVHRKCMCFWRFGGRARPLSGAAVFLTVVALVLAMWWLLDLVLA